MFCGYGRDFGIENSRKGPMEGLERGMQTGQWRADIISAAGIYKVEGGNSGRLVQHRDDIPMLCTAGNLSMKEENLEILLNATSCPDGTYRSLEIFYGPMSKSRAHTHPSPESGVMVCNGHSRGNHWIAYTDEREFLAGTMSESSACTRYLKRETVRSSVNDRLKGCSGGVVRIFGPVQPVHANPCQQVNSTFNRQSSLFSLFVGDHMIFSDSSWVITTPGIEVAVYNTNQDDASKVALILTIGFPKSVYPDY
ncbi:uncharacterized protein EV420DRAFT_1476201 [Desarmillaria tabescens]|uniref:Uncharacterized protein n=1 Tax=Armillaria tabescens TaxID=1929756 RepID=A0AA39TR04_ARMTA|nr:uncharacterized protein EV420DRAFT_1476201 [Desarmillaria tabescens]KAK0463468.1 hypothetical protein EV420DRAFT_1476201 [Desarmillaria tabescens]